MQRIPPIVIAIFLVLLAVAVLGAICQGSGTFDNFVDWVRSRTAATQPPVEQEITMADAEAGQCPNSTGYYTYKGQQFPCLQSQSEPTPDPTRVALEEMAEKLENAIAECDDRGIVATADGYTCKPEPTPMVDPTPVPPDENPATVGEKFQGCDVVAVSDFSSRGAPQVSVNDQPREVALVIRGKGDCPRALWDDETGVAIGKNYKFVLPAGFGIVVPGTTAAVYLPEGNLGDPFEVTANPPMIVAVGPLAIDIGLYEGFPRLAPVEWVDDITAWLWPIHDEEVRAAGAVPELIFIDQNGVIRNADPGMITDAFVRAGQ